MNIRFIIFVLRCCKVARLRKLVNVGSSLSKWTNPMVWSCRRRLFLLNVGCVLFAWCRYSTGTNKCQQRDLRTRDVVRRDGMARGRWWPVRAIEWSRSGGGFFFLSLFLSSFSLPFLSPSHLFFFPQRSLRFRDLGICPGTLAKGRFRAIYHRELSLVQISVPHTLRPPRRCRPALEQIETNQNPVTRAASLFRIMQIPSPDLGVPPSRSRLISPSISRLTPTRSFILYPEQFLALPRSLHRYIYIRRWISHIRRSSNRHRSGWRFM